ncbi:MAG: SpoIVB peptidase S55 domain-containing protein [Peptostreptococcaceae bacterium]
MFCNKNTSQKRLYTFLYLAILFVSISFNITYSNEKEEVEYLIPMGNIIQIDAELNNIIVRNNIKNSPFMVGDELLSINDNKINNYGDFSEVFYDLTHDARVEVQINRGEHKIDLKVKKEDLEKINLNNTVSGFATLTYIDPVTNEFGAVGHPISIGACRFVPIKKGSIFSTTNTKIEKSEKGYVGFLDARKENHIGSFVYNGLFGIKGNANIFDTSKFEKYEVASLSEVKNGDAQLISTNEEGISQKYDIEILSIDNQNSPESKTFKIKITDEKLLNKTGGIVQGMSGTPIIQNNKIIGAVSHAIENNPQNGYGVYIKWMMQE